MQLLVSLLIVAVSSANAFQTPIRTGGPARSLHQLPAVLQETAATSSQVDMNQYNLGSLEEISQEWTAVLRPATYLQEEGVFLEATSKSLMADTLTIAFPRQASLGLELLELAGGRQDGRGITIVSGIVPGGAADGSGIVPGDSLTQIDVVRRVAGFQEDSVSKTSVETECLGYDETVDAILSLPEELDDSKEETIVLTVKRLRRRPKVNLKLQYPPDMQEEDITLELFAGENLRRAMLVRGVKLNDKLAARFDSGGSGDCGYVFFSLFLFNRRFLLRGMPV